MERPGDAAAQVGGFHLNNPIHVQFWNDVLALANSKLANMHRQTAAGDCAGTVFDTRIRLAATMQNIEDAYYWNNQNGYGNMSNALIADCYASDILCQYESWYALPLHASLNNAVDACHKGINVVFTENQTQYNNANNGLPFERCKISSAILPGLPTAVPPPNPDLRMHMVDQWLHYMEGIEAANASTTDNIVWNDNDYADENNPRTWIVRTKANLLLHELFHYFNLMHTNIDALWPFYEAQCNIMCNVCSETSNLSITDAQLSVVYQSFAAAKTRIYIEGCPYNPTRPFVVNSNQTWQDNIRLYQDLVIQSGNRLILKCNLQMPPNSRIIVERGAKLIIDGGIINKSDCDCGRWQGIEVWGNTAVVHADLFTSPPVALTATDYINLSLSPTDPGIVVLYNDAKIENARTAITTQRRGGFFPDHYGGIIYAENSYFTNNRKGVELMQYTHTNYSRFKDCNITAATNHNIAFEGITVWACKNIIIENCAFENFNPAIYNNSIALTTYDAERLQVINNCHFNNVIKGIILQATNEGLGNAIISDNVFTNCRLGIQNFQTREMIARGNTFSVTAINAQHITLSGNCGYSITNNTFINGTASVAAFFTSLLTPGNNLIDCNTFQNNGTAVYANSNNSGLHFQNNDFNTLNADVQLDNNGTLPNQGTFDPIEGFLPYFNFFTLNNPTSRITTTGTTNPFFYYYHTDPTNYTPDANDRLVPHCFAGETPPFPGCPTAYNYNAIEIPNLPATYTYTGCLDLNGDGFPGILPPDEECKTRECYDSLKLIIAALETQKDGGNKEELLSDLYSSPEALETYQKYLDASPYLTDQVLAEAAENALLSPTRKANILLANAPLSNSMMNTAYQHVSPTVYQMLYAIKYYFKISDRDRLDMRIGTEVQKKEALFNELFTRFQNDNDTTGMYSFLLAENTPFALRSLIGQKARYGNIDDAQTLLNSLPADTPDEQDCKTVQQINLQRLSATEGFELSEAQYQTLHSIADAYSTQAPAAQALLNLLTGEPFEWLVPTGSEKTTPIPYPQVPLIDLKTANRLWVQPNPAKEQVSISIPPFVAEKQATLYLYNTQGTSVQQIPVPYGEYQLSIPTHHLPNGVYFIRLVADGIRLANAKLVIQH